MCLCIRATLLLDPGCAYSVSLQPDFVSRLPTVVLSHAHALWAMVQVCVCVCAYSVSLRPDFVSRLPTVVLSHAHALWAMV